jgi:phospholipase C
MLVGAAGLVGYRDTQVSRARAPGAVPADIHKIKHVVIIMQENRSFDTYFGTYPGVDGIPMTHGVPTVCVPDPANGRCIKPFYDNQDRNYGGPHSAVNATQDIDVGKMDGFVAQQVRSRTAACKILDDPNCGGAANGQPDVMGYHDGRDIPNYWAYARNFVLQDHMFEPNASWSLPQHLFMVSEWSAHCLVPADAMSCVNALQNPSNPPDFGAGTHRLLLRRGGSATPTPAPPGIAITRGAVPDYAWTDLTYLLHRYSVSWAYYVQQGIQPDCPTGAMACMARLQRARTPGIWNPLPYFDTVKQDGQLGNIQDLTAFYAAARAGTLPAVSWIAPSNADSEHPPALVSVGQAYVTALINAIMRSADWSSTAIFLSWDDWGGFYDQVMPPTVDQNGYGMRVPGLVISAYARNGYVDHQVLSQDAYVKFIEDDFLNSQRIDPMTDGRPDPRPDVRENAPVLGNLLADFDFSQAPRPPLILPIHPRTNLVRPGSMKKNPPSTARG